LTAELDRAGAIRRGESIDVGRLTFYLRSVLPEVVGDAPIEITQFPSGYSNLTYLLHAGARELVLRRPPFGRVAATAHDMGREYRILSRVILRRRLPEGASLSPPRARALGEAFIRELARLHRVDYRTAGLGDLGRPEGYVERQVSGWRKRYLGSQTDEIPDLERAGSWLADNVPAPAGPALVHNDFKYDNLVLDPDDLSRIRAVLDWEMATIGDPLLDLGTSLGYWVEADDPQPLRRFRFGPTDQPGSPTREELAAIYADESGRPVDNLAFYYCFGLFKIAVIAQQIYYRYKQGLTQDDRFSSLGGAIRVLGERACAVSAAR
jgi:aminoglycoside phosphotransferase (APT) family kinase protein